MESKVLKELIRAIEIREQLPKTGSDSLYLLQKYSLKFYETYDKELLYARVIDIIDLLGFNLSFKMMKDRLNDRHYNMITTKLEINFVYYEIILADDVKCPKTLEQLYYLILEYVTKIINMKQ